MEPMNVKVAADVELVHLIAGLAQTGLALRERDGELHIVRNLAVKVAPLPARIGRAN